MTQFKHTPGPWEILNWDGCFEIICGENLNPLTVCVIENRHRDIYCINPEANAKLIAAAPELLEALIECLEGVKELNGEYQDGWDDVIEKASLIIKKSN